MTHFFRKITGESCNNQIDNCDMIAIDGKVWVPKSMQKGIIEWYYCILQHAGINRTVNSICQVFNWKGLRPMVKKYVSSCDTCQLATKQRTKIPTGRSRSSPHFMTRTLGRLFTSVAAVPRRSGSLTRRLERKKNPKSTYYL